MSWVWGDVLGVHSSVGCISIVYLRLISTSFCLGLNIKCSCCGVFLKVLSKVMFFFKGDVHAHKYYLDHGTKDIDLKNYKKKMYCIYINSKR